jgi:hypothetical protein
VAQHDDVELRHPACDGRQIAQAAVITLVDQQPSTESFARQRLSGRAGDDGDQNDDNEREN